MEKLSQLFSSFGTQLCAIVWGPFTLALLTITGLYFTIGTGFFQFRNLGLWLRSTLFSLVADRSVRRKESGGISQFQALSTSLAGTVGTGSIVGVATALAAGGRGAIFWMWISALLGMMTKYAENVLGNRYRYRDEKGNWKGGPMVYMEHGVGSRVLAGFFCVFCILASFGMGNMAQANSIAGALHSSFGVSPAAVAILLAVVTGVVLFGGIQRVAAVAERFVPFMTLFYLAGAGYLLFHNRQNLPEAICGIFSDAFHLRAAAGGVGGYAVFHTMRYGIARGIFSNEAGLGSSVIVNASSNVREPVRQGMWGIFEVFVSTAVICTASALTILTADVLDTGLDGAALAIAAFSNGFGAFGGAFLSVAVICFAFSSILGWSHYGERAVEHLLGTRPIPLYRLLFTATVGLGCIAHLDSVWAISDAFNGLMALPNLLAILLLSKEVFALTRKFLKENSCKKPPSVLKRRKDHCS